MIFITFLNCLRERNQSEWMNEWMKKRAVMWDTWCWCNEHVWVNNNNAEIRQALATMGVKMRLWCWWWRRLIGGWVGGVVRWLVGCWKSNSIDDRWREENLSTVEQTNSAFTHEENHTDIHTIRHSTTLWKVNLNIWFEQKGILHNKSFTVSADILAWWQTIRWWCIWSIYWCGYMFCNRLGLCRWWLILLLGLWLDILLGWHLMMLLLW